LVGDAVAVFFGDEAFFAAAAFAAAFFAPAFVALVAFAEAISLQCLGANAMGMFRACANRPSMSIVANISSLWVYRR
jgi:hypothetical protein